MAATSKPCLASHPRVIVAGSRFLDDYAAIVRLAVFDRVQPDAELLLARSRHEARLGNFLASRATAHIAADMHPEWGAAHALEAQAHWHLALLSAGAIEASPWSIPSAESCRTLLGRARKAYLRAAHAAPDDKENSAAAAWIGTMLACTRTESQTTYLLRDLVHAPA